MKNKAKENKWWRGREFFIAEDDSISEKDVDVLITTDLDEWVLKADLAEQVISAASRLAKERKAVVMVVVKRETISTSLTQQLVGRDIFVPDVMVIFDTEGCMETEPFSA